MEEYYFEMLIIFRKLIYSRMTEKLPNIGEVKDFFFVRQATFHHEYYI
jgi:hypothetical protein